MTAPRTWPLVLRLGTAQTLAWGSTYYLPALLARPMADGLGLPISQIWIAFTVALLASAALGPFAGRAIDRWGGRPVLMGTSVMFALGLACLSQVQGSTSLMLAWLLIGMAMGSGLYEAAFAALVRLQGTQARAAPSPASRSLPVLPAPWAGRSPPCWRPSSAGAAPAWPGPACTCWWGCR